MRLTILLACLLLSFPSLAQVGNVRFRVDSVGQGVSYIRGYTFIGYDSVATGDRMIVAVDGECHELDVLTAHKTGTRFFAGTVNRVLGVGEIYFGAVYRGILRKMPKYMNDDLQRCVIEKMLASTTITEPPLEFVDTIRVPSSVVREQGFDVNDGLLAFSPWGSSVTYLYEVGDGDPREIAQVPFGGSAYIWGHFLTISRLGTWKIYDISDRARPVELSTGSSTLNSYYKGHFYGMANDNGNTIIRIDPYSGKTSFVARSLKLPYPFYQNSRAAFYGNAMYIPMNSVHSDTVFVVDLKGDSLATKILVDGYGNNTSLFVHKDRLFIGSRDTLYCFTLDDPLRPQRKWAFGGIKGGAASFHHLKIVGDYAYMSDNNADGSVIAVISLKDIDNPRLVKKVKIKGVSPRSMAIDGGYLYVADRNAPYIEIYRIGFTEKIPSLDVSQFKADEINTDLVQTTDIIAEETVTDTIKTRGIITPKFWMHGGNPIDKDDNPGFFNANYVSIHAGLNTPAYGSPFFVSGGAKPWDYYFLVQTSNTPTKGGALLVKTNQSSGSGWQVEIDSAYSQQSTSWPVWSFWTRGVKWDANGNFGGHFRVNNRPLFGWGTWSPLEFYVKLWDDGDWQWLKYPDTRNDGGAPTSIVSTDANGYVKMHPVEYNRGTSATIQDGGSSAPATNIMWHYTRVGNEVTYLLSFDIAGTGTQKVYEVTLPFDATNTLILDQMQASAVNVSALTPLGVLIDDSDGDKKPNITVNIPSGETGRIDIEVHYRAN